MPDLPTFDNPREYGRTDDSLLLPGLVVFAVLSAAAALAWRWLR